MRAFKSYMPPAGGAEETALSFDGGRALRLLILPPLFDEANKFRRQLSELMFRLDLSGIDSFLPDMPGCGDSLFPQEEVTLEILRAAAVTAAQAFGATHVFSLRTSALFAPEGLPGWRYAATSGKKALRPMLRARTLSAQESGKAETIAELEALGMAEGITLSGWRIGAAFFNDLNAAEVPAAGDGVVEISQEDIGGSPLWLRAEPSEDPEQADTLAAIIAIGLVG